MTKELTIDGFKVLYVRRPNKIQSIRVVVNAGSSSDMIDKWGTGHFMEHMAFKGTTHHTYKEINQMLSSLGDANAYTSYNKIVYRINALKDNFKAAAKLLFEIVFEPAMGTKDFENEKTVIVEELQAALDDPWPFFYYNAQESFWGKQIGHAIGGHKENIEKMEMKDLIEYQDKYFKKNNMLIAVIGDISEREVVKTFKDLLKDIAIPDGTTNNVLTGRPNVTDLKLNHSSKQAIMSRGPGSVEARKRNFVQDMFAHCLGKGMHSLLFDRIREELGLCYSIGAMISNTFSYDSCFQIYCFLDEGNIGKVRNELYKIISEVKHKGFDEKLFNTAKKNLIFSLMYDGDTSGTYGKTFVDSYFEFHSKPVTLEEGIKKISRLQNKNMIDFANEIFHDGIYKYIEMTQAKG